MIYCECPVCDSEINLRGCEEEDIIKCPTCGTDLEVVSLSPPVLEEYADYDDDGWDDDDWDNDDDDDDDDDNWDNDDLD